MNAHIDIQSHEYRPYKTLHACLMTRADYFLYKGISIGKPKSPEEKGYLVIHDKDLPSERTTWCPSKKFTADGAVLIEKHWL